MSSGQRSAVRRVPIAPWLSGLRGRITALAALIAMLSTSLCALAGAHALRAGFTAHEIEHIAHDALSVVRQLERTVEDLAFEVEDYAAWSELYEQMPQPTREWAEINLIPGAQAGRLTQAFAIFVDGRCIGRHRSGDHRHDEASPDDPASAAALALLARRVPVAGFASLRGHPALVVARPIERSDGSGPAAGVLIGMTYFGPAALRRVHLHDSDITITVVETGTPGAALTHAGNDTLSARTVVRCIDSGFIEVTVTQKAETHQVALLQAQRAVLISGVLGVIISAALGVVLGLRWVRPLFQLARACRERVDAPDRPLPPLGDLEEAAVLGAALDDLAAAEHRQREALSEALAREEATSAVQQRFLAQLGHEMGDPVRALRDVVQRISIDGRLSPEDVALARERVALLEERLHEVLGLAVGMDDGAAVGREQDASLYLSGIADVMRPQAVRRGVAILVETPTFTVAVDARLLSPVLVNLVANAVRVACSKVVLSAVPEGDLVRWEVIDDGPGIPVSFRQAYIDTCQRGSVLPGTVGIGLGLAVVLANVRALGGRVDVDATGEEGTRISVTVPQRSSGAGGEGRASAVITARHRRRRPE